MEKTAIIAITKNGIKIAKRIKSKYDKCDIFAPSKMSDNNSQINWFEDSTSSKVGELFKIYDALICIFSLGAVVRLISSHLSDKKKDPAVVVIDDVAKFVISTLSGHIGGANKLTEELAGILNATPVITTAADVNMTIAVDLVGKEFGWTIDDDSTVTKVSAIMVNEEKIGIYQEAGEKDWWAPKKNFPKNITIYDNVDNLRSSNSKGYLIISDKILDDKVLLEKAVVYRPKTLVVGIGLHWDTNTETIKSGIESCMKKYNLSTKSIARFATMKREPNVVGLQELSKEWNVPVDYFEKDQLADIVIPNPSKIVQAFEGTPSVSEASALRSSNGKLIVEKQKFPPNLTVAIARISK